MRTQLQVSSAVPSLSDPRYRIRAHAIGSSQESDGFTASLSPSDFCNLMRREQWLPTHSDAGTFRSFTAFRGPRLDQLSFEFRKTTQDCKHQPSGWRCRVRPWVCQGFEQATTVSNLLHYGQQVDCRPPKPVQPCHDHHGPRLQCLKEPLQLGPVAFSPTDLLTVNFRTTGLPQLFELRLQGLALCGHPSITNVHGTNLTRNYDTSSN